MELRFYALGEIDEERLYYAVMAAGFKGKWLFVQHKKRSTWEMPAGRRKIGESILEAAKRELFEETGALEYDLKEICDYSVTERKIRYGRLFFTEIKEKGPLPDFEIAKVCLKETLPAKLTYPIIQPLLWQKIQDTLHNEHISEVTKDSCGQ